MLPEDRQLDDAVVAYLESVEAGQAPDRAAYPQLAEFFADEDAVRHLMSPWRELAQGNAAQTVGMPSGGAEAARLSSFGAYEVIEELGRGAMGVVYKARHTTLNRLVAMKMILVGDRASVEQKTRFLAEARAVAHFQHPNIVQVHDFGEHDQRPYMALEFMEGGSLASRLKGGALPDREAAQIIEQLARAVEHAHANGIVHRDLKPANVLLTKDGTPKIADFGLARFLGADHTQTASGAVLGTASYMAPEQAAGRVKEIGPLADVYALGAVLYELLTSRPPFRGATWLETLLMVQEEPPDRPSLYNPHVSRSLQAICLRCLAKDPHDRYPSGAALADDLDRFLNGQPVRADGGATSRWVQTMLRETRYTEVMTRWGSVTMGIAVLHFFVSLGKSILLWHGVTDYAPFFALWTGSSLAAVLLVWACRLRCGPPLSHVERQLAQILAIFLAGFFLTAWQYYRTGGPVAGLLPILMLEVAVAFGSIATILGGSYYVMAAAYLATAILEAVGPVAGPLISAAVCAPALFCLGWKYRHRAAAL
jgi:eukaryotic-like serine/threonine-protein kinase